MYAVDLKVNYLRNPMGIDIVAPRFMWKCEDGVRQSAWQLICTDDREKVLWDSKKMDGSAMRCTYGGTPLKSRDRVYWQVKLWDENGEEGEWSEKAYFELGLLQPSDWKAKWIAGNYSVNRKKRYPVDCFLKELEIDGQVQRARLYITACGLYEARLDGEKIGDFCLAPGITDYRKRVQYQTYDVTDMLGEGKHEFTVALADGWYRGSTGAWGLKNQYGTETKLLAQLEIEYADGRSRTVVSDESFCWSDDGAIRFADNKDGEIVEAFREPSYNGTAKLTSHNVVPTASNNVSVVEKEHFSAKLTRTPNGRRLFDFGQNMAGYISFSVKAKKGQKIKIRLGELIGKDGNLTLDNIQCRRKNFATPLQQIIYTCKDGVNDYKTTFAVFGFRYAEIDTQVDIGEEAVTAIAVYSDIEQTGFFNCSNGLVNKLVDITAWSTKSNSLDIPTDCPTRERHGWTGDAQIFFETASYLFDYAAFSEKYITDVYDGQKASGILPQIAPGGGVNSYMKWMDGSVGWSDVGVLIPYRFAKIYGDDEILVRYYDRMKKYARFMMGRCGKWGGPLAENVKGLSKEARKYLVNRGQSYGEWAEPEEVHKMHWSDCAAPHPEVSTAYTAYVLGLMAEIAAKLGKKKDEKIFRTYSEGCKRAYQELVRTAKYSLDTDRQANLVRPLAFDLLNEKQTEYAKKRLIKALRHYDWRLGTGFLSTPLILHVLESYDIDSAYRLLENEKMPGWLFMPKSGATTIWESWEGTQAQNGIASLNHYSKGAVCEWLFRSMCGIEVAGENHFRIEPKPGGHFKFAKASYNSVYGKVESGWERKGSKLEFSITIPANCTAKICLPGREPETVGAGVYLREV